jgi:hypothetical protein
VGKGTKRNGAGGDSDYLLRGWMAGSGKIGVQADAILNWHGIRLLIEC